MLRRIVQTDNELSGLIARAALGIVILPHGLQKLAGAFGGFGFSASVDYFSSIGIPAIVGVLVVLGESLGALALLAGFLTRFTAASINLIMLGAIFITHLPNGFFMNWYGSQAGEGFEFHLLALGLGAISVIVGGGKWSVDQALAERLAPSLDREAALSNAEACPSC